MPLADQSVQCCVTSPPYWGLRDYGLEPTEWPAVEYAPMAGLPNVVVESWRGCLGLEPTPEMFVGHLVAVFREVRRVLRNDGVAWVNLGDSYSSNQKGTGGDGSKSGLRRDGRSEESRIASAKLSISHQSFGAHNMDTGLKPKDLVGIPWRVAFALQADGWWLRSDVIWHKPNPMPESVTDRPTKAHEYVFLLAKSARYFYDAEAVKESGSTNSHGGGNPDNPDRYAYASGRNDGGTLSFAIPAGVNGRNRRTVWTIPTRGYSGAHFATFPPDLVGPCVLAGTSQRGACPVCGAPWERVVEKSGRVKQKWGTSVRPEYAVGPMDRGGHSQAETGGIATGMINQYETIGWRPTCNCPGLDGDSPWPQLDMHWDGEANWPVAPCIVLDPFCGSGTVGAVCRDLGRQFIGLDLSETYLRELALPRAENTNTVAAMTTLPLFAELAVAIT